MKKLLAVDFEFNRTQEPRVYPMSVSFRPYEIEEKKGLDSGRIYPQGGIETYWLRSRTPYGLAKERIVYWMGQGYAILCFGGIAEARALNAMGLDEPSLYRMFDLYVLHKQLTHTWHRFKYGRYVKDGKIRKSTPPRYTRDNEELPGDYNQTKNSLGAAVAHALGQIIDSNEKDIVRDYIISDPKVITPEWQERILRYNESDIVFLPQLYCVLMDNFCEASGMDWEKAYNVMLYHGEYIKSIAAQEDEGIPLDLVSVKNLSHNYTYAVNELIVKLNEKYPFYLKNTKGEWVCSYAQFKKYLEENNLTKGWPKTPSGKYATDEDTLDQYQYGDSANALVAYSQTNRSIRNICHFASDSKGQMMGNIGSDGRMRTWLAPFGTLTGRNAPKPSKGYLPAMARWVRSMINPPPGYVIIEFDWSGQEFLIAGSMSGDKNMLEAYASGDPYVWLGKAAKVIPPNGNKKTHPTERKVFKVLQLGLQFQLGLVKLAAALTLELGREYTVAEAEQLRNFHRKVFSTYWLGVKKSKELYEKVRRLVLKDGWCLFPDSKSVLSTGNFPVQGTGAGIYRNAVIGCYRRGLPVIYGLHDAIRICVPEQCAKQAEADLLQIMADAVKKFLPHEIRNEGKIVYHGKPFVEEGAEEMYQLMKPYLAQKFIFENNEKPLAFHLEE